MQLGMAAFFLFVYYLYITKFVYKYGKENI